MSPKLENFHKTKFETIIFTFLFLQFNIFFESFKLNH